MKPLDLFLLALIAVGAYKGYRKGLILEVIFSLAFIFGLITGLLFFEQGAKWLIPHLPKTWKPIAPILAFVLVFLLSRMALKHIGKWLRQQIRYTIFGHIDKAGGAVVGLLKVCFMLGTMLWLVGLAGIKVPATYTQGSIVYPMLAQLGPHTIRWFTILLPFLKPLVKNLEAYLKSK